MRCRRDAVDDGTRAVCRRRRTPRAQRNKHVPLAGETSNSDDSRFDMAFGSQAPPPPVYYTALRAVSFPASAYERVARVRARRDRVSRNVKTTPGTEERRSKKTGNFERATFVRVPRSRDVRTHTLSETNRAVSDRLPRGVVTGLVFTFVVSSIIWTRASQTVGRGFSYEHARFRKRKQIVPFGSRYDVTFRVILVLLPLVVAFTA